MRPSNELPIRLQWIVAVTSIVTGIVSLIFAGWAIYITIELASKDQTDLKLTNLISEVVEQNKKLDQELNTLQDQLAELQDISGRALRMEQNSDSSKRFLSDQLALFRVNTTPKLLFRSVDLDIDRSTIFTNLTNVGDRPAMDIQITCFVFQTSINDKYSSRTSRMTQNTILNIPGRSEGTIFTMYDVEKEITFLKYNCIYRDPMFNRVINDSFYVMPRIDSATQKIRYYAASAEQYEYLENQLIEYTPGYRPEVWKN